MIFVSRWRIPRCHGSISEDVKDFLIHVGLKIELHCSFSLLETAADKTISPQVPFSSFSSTFNHTAWSSSADHVCHGNGNVQILLIESCKTATKMTYRWDCFALRRFQVWRKNWTIETEHIELGFSFRIELNICQISCSLICSWNGTTASE